MSRIEDLLLGAYVDDELDPEDEKDLEKQIKANPEVVQKVSRLREVSAQARAALSSKLEEPPPAHLVAAIRAAEQKSKDQHRYSKGIRQVLPWAVAASLIAFMGGGVGGWYARNSMEHDPRAAMIVSEEQVRILVEKTRLQALENNISGNPLRWQGDDGLALEVEPIKTFKRDGRYCREFRETIVRIDVERASFGVACRTESGKWQLRYRVIVPNEGTDAI